MNVFETARLSEWTEYLAQLDALLILMLITAISIVALNRRYALNAKTVPLQALPNRRFWLGVIIVAVFLRAPLLLDEPWYDETFSMAIAAIEDTEDLSTAVESDVHPIGYYAILASINWPGMEHVAIRIPAFYGGLVLIWLMYRLTLRLSKENVAAAQIVAVLVAVLPAPVYYSTEGRYPMWLAMMAAGALLSLLENRKWWFVLCAGFLPWMHYIGYIYFGVLGFFAMLRYQHRWIVTVLPASFFALAMLPLMFEQSADVTDGFWLYPQIPFWHLIDMTIGRGVMAVWMVVLVYVPVLVGMMLGLLWIRRDGAVRDPDWHAWAAVAIGVPALAFVISMVWNPVYLSRSLIAPALLMLIPMGIYLSRMRHVLTAGLLIAVMLSLTNLQMTPRTDKINVFQHCEGADVVYATGTNIAVLAKAYTDLPVYTWSKSNNMHQALNDEAKRVMGIPMGYVYALDGEVCVVSQLDYYTRIDEAAHLGRIQQHYDAEIIEYETNSLIRYSVMRISNE